MKLTPHQQKIYNDIVEDIENYNGFGQCFKGSLIGPAGVGKSTLTAELLNYFLNQTEYTVALTAPTHRALKVINDMSSKYKHNKKLQRSTIHSFLGLKMERKLDKMYLVSDFVKNKKTTDVLIIDESSMISSELYNFIEKAILPCRIKVILYVGDSCQLLPIEASKQHAVYGGNIREYKLTEVIRQAQDSSILAKATDIRKCIESKNYDRNLLKFQDSDDIVTKKDMVDLLADFCLNEQDDKMITSFTNNSVNYYNQFVRQYVHRDLETIPEYVEGEMVTLQEAYVSDSGNIQLRNGQDVMITMLEKCYDEKNGLYYWNFKAEAEDDSTIDVRIIDKDSINVLKAKLSNFSDIARGYQKNRMFEEMKATWDEFWSLKGLYADVKHSHACTIHKMQGSSVDEVYIDLEDLVNSCRDDDMLFRLVYVGLTRAKSKVKIFQG